MKCLKDSETPLLEGHAACVIQPLQPPVTPLSSAWNSSLLPVEKQKIAGFGVESGYWERDSIPQMQPPSVTSRAGKGGADQVASYSLGQILHRIEVRKKTLPLEEGLGIF